MSDTVNKLALDSKLQEIIKRSLTSGQILAVDAKIMPEFLLNILKGMIQERKAANSSSANSSSANSSSANSSVQQKVSAVPAQSASAQSASAQSASVQSAQSASAQSASAQPASASTASTAKVPAAAAESAPVATTPLTEPRLAVQAIGQLPVIPSIQVRNKTTGNVQDCKAWFAEKLRNPEYLPAPNTVARTYLDAEGDAGKQDTRRNEIIQYICDHDSNARRIIENVGRTIRALLKKTLMIPQLLAENARLCAVAARPDLLDDQRLLMEQLAYMAMQMKRLTDSLNFSYDPATQKFYRLDDQGEITETLDNENLPPIFGLDTEEVKELWDVLSSSQSGTLYGQKLNIYPAHQNCKGTIATTPMFNIVLAYPTVTAELLAAASANEADSSNLALREAVARAYLLRLWELTAPSSEPPSVKTYKMPYNKAYAEEIFAPLPAKLRPYISVLPFEVPEQTQKGVRVHIRIPFDFFEVNVPAMSTTLAAVLGANVGSDVKQLALTSLAIRPPKAAPNASGADAWLADAATQNRKLDIIFMSYDELDPAKFDPPGVPVKNKE